MIRYTKHVLLVFIFMSVLFSCKTTKDLPTVQDVDLDRYMGKWYEIARLPNRFEKGLKCATADYELKDNGKIQVINRGHQINNPSEVSKVKGTARIPDKSKPGQLKVVFFWPFGGDYYIIELDKDYQYVMVGDPSRKYLWILSREKQLSEDVYNKLVSRADELGFKTGQLIKVEQDCVN